MDVRIVLSAPGMPGAEERLPARNQPALELSDSRSQVPVAGCRL